MLRPKLARGKLDEAFAGAEEEVAGFVSAAMRDTTAEVKEAFREQVRAALGGRLANAVRGATYPRNRDSLDPTGWIYATPSKTGRGAAAIIDSYAEGRTITARNKRWLAVPTDDCPRKRQGQAMTPGEVETKYGRKLQFVDPADKGFKTPSVRHRGVAYLVLKGLVIRKATGRWRNATERERAGRTRNPRPVQAVVMFTLVHQVKKPKRLDLSAPAALAEARFTANLNARWR